MAANIKEFELPGSFTLDDTLNFLVQKEENRNRNVTALKIVPDGPDGHLSLATLVKQPVGVPFPRLMIVAVPPGASDADIEELAPGKELKFRATIWVENKKTEVAVLR